MQDENIPEIQPLELEPEDHTTVEEFIYNDDGEEDLKATLKKVRKDLKSALKEKQEYLTSWQRERADFLNYKKDEAERSGSLTKYAREKIIMDLLPVLDSYDMAFANKDAWEKVDKNWRIGVEYIHQQLLKVLSDYGVTEVETKEGDAFDPNLHQPIESIDTDDQARDHTIAQVIQKGYKTATHTLRPARVNVYAFK